MAGSEYYDHTTYPSNGAHGSSSAMRSELDLIEAGFGKLPDLSGNGNKAVVINAGGTGMTVTTGTLALAGNFATAGAYAITLTATGATGITLPTTGTLATLAGDEILSNKTLVAPALGTPASGVLTNCTGLPIGAGISGLGTGVATALAINIGSSGSPVLNAGVLGTPSSGTLTSCTGLPAGGLTATATDKIFGRSSSGAGAGEEITCTAAGRALLDAANAAAQRSTLGAAEVGANSTITSFSACTSISTASGCEVHGTNTNNAASSGYKGEYVESIVSTYQNAPTTNQYGDLTSITLTAGDWDISALLVGNANGSTFTTLLGGIGTVTGNSGTGVVSGDTRIDLASPTGNYDTNGIVPPKRVSLSGSATYYLKVLAIYSAGTPRFAGRISARRVR